MSSPGVDWPALAAPLGHEIHQVERRAGRREGYGTHFGASPVVGPKDRQQPVSEEFQDFATALRHRPRHAGEALVEQRHQLAPRQAIGKGREAAQIGIEQHRLDVLHFAALHRSGQHPRRRIAAEIGLEQSLPDRPHGDRLHGESEQRQRFAERRQVGFAKAAVSIGGGRTNAP
jgi:hypothetical protein